MEDPKTTINRALPELYEELISNLKYLDRQLKLGAEDQVVIFKAIWLVKKFLDANPAVRDAGLTAPFGRILASLNDVRAGKAAPLFKIHRNPRGGRPSGLSGTIAVQAVAVACLRLLLDAGIDVHEAASFVERQLSIAGYKRSGKGPISVQTIINWRDEMGGRIAEDAAKICNSIVTDIRAQRRNELAVEDMRETVKSIIRALRDEGIPSIEKSD